MVSEQFYTVPVDGNLEGKLVIKIRNRRVSYEKVAELMRNGYDVFISDLPRRSAYFAKNRLNMLLGTKTTAWPANLDRVPGYLFTMDRRGILGRRKIARY